MKNYISMIFKVSLCLALTFALHIIKAESLESDQAQLIWKLINGTNLKENSAEARKMTEALKNRNLEEAALSAIYSESSSVFTGHVRRIFTPLAGRELNYSEQTGDFVLTWMAAGLLEIPIKDLFLTDIRYSFDASKWLDDAAQANSLLTDRQLRRALDEQRLANRGQNYIANPDYRLGVLTSHQYGQAIFEGGTNRRPIKKIAEDFLCVPSIDNIMNFRISDVWVGRDIPRTPGNDARVYLNRCVGCHAGMDALRGAFAGFDYDLRSNQLVWRSFVQPKMNNNTHVFPYGYSVFDDGWQHLGYLPMATSQIGEKFKGPKALAEMVSKDLQTYSCLVKRTQQAICPSITTPVTTREQIAYRFKKSQSMGKMIADVVAHHCLGDQK